MEYHDKVLKCSECSQEFIFTAGEQMFFADKGFKNEPKRCKDCKAKRSQSPGQASSVQRSLFFRIFSKNDWKNYLVSGFETLYCRRENEHF